MPHFQIFMLILRTWKSNDLMPLLVWDDQLEAERDCLLAYLACPALLDCKFFFTKLFTKLYVNQNLSFFIWNFMSRFPIFRSVQSAIKIEIGMEECQCQGWNFVWIAISNIVSVNCITRVKTEHNCMTNSDSIKYFKWYYDDYYYFNGCDLKCWSYFLASY